jgi:hypothetical protein
MVVHRVIIFDSVFWGRLQPENGIPFNNLAEVLNSQGKLKEALAAAQRAVDLGGPFLDTFRQTLEEIKKE